LSSEAAGGTEKSALTTAAPRPHWIGVRRATQLLSAAIPANDRHRTAQHYQGTHCLTGVNLRRRYSAVIGPLIVPRFVIVRLLDITGGEGEACSE
jgi:hypothetical protein